MFTHNRFSNTVKASSQGGGCAAQTQHMDGLHVGLRNKSTSVEVSENDGFQSIVFNSHVSITRLRPGAVVASVR